MTFYSDQSCYDDDDVGDFVFWKNIIFYVI